MSVISDSAACTPTLLFYSFFEQNGFTDMPTHGLSFMPKITIKDANKVTEVLFCLWKRDKNT